jgi:ring-1,2-phenylacetyl-CoA epoxidase subunit PaaB
MTSSQWPVYQVFERPGPGRPMRAAGSVHAVDAEMALQNAWAVYGRRPTAIALWVVPRDVVLMRARDELAGCTLETLSHSDGRGQGGGSSSSPRKNVSERTFCVFRRSGPRIVYEEATPVVAASAEQALARAVEHHGGKNWHACWVFPAAAITSSEATHGECSFAPQEHKWFRDHKSFPVGALLKDAREEAEEVSDA